MSVSLIRLISCVSLIAVQASATAADLYEPGQVDDDRYDHHLLDDRDDGQADGHFERERKQLKDDWTDDFIDTDFRKSKFKDLRDLKGRSLRDDAGKHPPDERTANGSDHGCDTPDDYPGDDDLHFLKHAEYDYFGRKGDRLKEIRDERRTFKELTTPYPFRFHDWVPSHVDRLQNGAFVNSPDNGFPVPYRLNGHLDIQRGLPWEAKSD